MSQATKLDHLLESLGASLQSKDAGKLAGKEKDTDNKRGKHLPLLDGLALFLVQRSKTDVAAVSMTMVLKDGMKTATFFYATNNGYTAKDEEFANFIAAQANQAHTAVPGQVSREIIAAAATHCRDKIRRRIEKLANVWKGVRKSAADISAPCFAAPDPKALEDFRDLTEEPIPSENGSWNVWLSSWLDRLDTDSVRSSHRKVVRLLLISYCISSSKNLLQTLYDGTLQHRMRKLGQYAETAVEIALLARGMGERARFLAKPVPSPPTTLIDSMPAPTDIFADVAKDNGIAYDLDYLLSKAEKLSLDAELATKAERNRTLQTHCECIIAESMLKEPHVNLIEIGVSKGSCWPCTRFLQEFSKGVQMKFSVSHGKVYRGWQFPSFGSEALHGKLTVEAEERVVELLRRTDEMKQRGMSDSQYVSSDGDHDEEDERQNREEKKAFMEWPSSSSDSF